MTTAKQAQGDARGPCRTCLEPCQIGRPAFQNLPLGALSIPVSDKRDFLPQAIAHFSSAGNSPQPSTDWGNSRAAVAPKNRAGCERQGHRL